MDLTSSTRSAWDLAARKYAPVVERDVEFLRGGGVALADREVRVLGDLSRCGRAIHLCCSHGLDALSLLNLGVGEVVGVDLSAEMLSLAGAKAGALGARATWVHAAVLEVPSELNGSADLVFTGNGALPWMSDIGAWARVVARLLRPGGRLVVVEGHPLNWVWDPEATVHRLSLDGRSYFDAAPRANETFPASAVTRFARDAEDAPAAWEYQWSLGQVVTATAEAGLVVVRLEEYPDHFWPQFGSIAAVDFARLPHTFSLVARAPAA